MSEEKRKIRLKIDPDRITVDDLITLEEGSMKTRGARDLIARFVVDDNGEFMTDEDAKRAVGKLSLAELLKVGNELAVQVQGMMGEMVPTVTVSE